MNAGATSTTAAMSAAPRAGIVAGAGSLPPSSLLRGGLSFEGGSMHAVDMLMPQVGGDARGLRCPRCETAGMAELVQAGVAIDRCVYCHGVWLDAGELEQLIAAADRRARRRRLRALAVALPRPSRGRSEDEPGGC
jgi:Zn-finger nucleic acid-binding protein